MNRFICSILFLALAYTGESEACSLDWPKFIQNLETYVQVPSEQNANTVVDILPTCEPKADPASDTYIDKVVPLNRDRFSDYSKLNVLAQRGDVGAIKIMLKMTWLFGGSENAETLAEDLGKITSTHPSEFLTAYAANEGHVRGLIHVLAELGPDYVDDLPGQIKELKRRYKALSDAKNAPKGAQTECLQTLHFAIDELESVQSPASETHGVRRR